MAEEIEQKSADLAGFSAKPEKTWFFQRGDGYIFACNEAQAWELMTNKSEWRRRDFRMLGVSNGETFFRMVREGKARVITLKAETDALRTEWMRFDKTLERLKFDELLDETDPKVIRAQELKDAAEKKFRAKEKEYVELSKSVSKNAFDAELEIAKANGTQMPENQDVITPDAKSRGKIMGTIGPFL